MQCRPPGIYKAHYLQDLVKRYGDSNESIAAPELPDWCYDEEEGLSDNEEENGRTVEDGSHSDGRRKRMRRDPRLKVNFSLKSCLFVIIIIIIIIIIITVVIVVVAKILWGITTE